MTDTPPRKTPTKAAPRKATAAATADKPKGGRPSKLDQLADQLAAQLAGVGAMVAVWNRDDGESIIRHAPTVARSLAELGESSPSVKKALEGSVGAGAWAGVLVAVAPLVLEIVSHHSTIGADDDRPADDQAATAPSVTAPVTTQPAPPLVG